MAKKQGPVSQPFVLVCHEINQLPPGPALTVLDPKQPKPINPAHHKQCQKQIHKDVIKLCHNQTPHLQKLALKGSSYRTHNLGIVLQKLCRLHYQRAYNLNIHIALSFPCYVFNICTH